MFEVQFADNERVSTGDNACLAEKVMFCVCQVLAYANKTCSCGHVLEIAGNFDDSGVFSETQGQ